MFVILLADLKAKPDANYENTQPMRDWSCQLCNQPSAPSPFRRTGFESDTTRTNLARPVVTGFAPIMAAILTAWFSKDFRVLYQLVHFPRRTDFRAVSL